MAELAGRILTPGGVVEGTIAFEERIGSIRPTGLAEADRELWILPGFVDLHVHGGGGGDTMNGSDAVRCMARLHARHGTTALLPTTVTAPDEDLLVACAGVAEVLEAPEAGEAAVLGLHLEGPFISSKRLGAQPPFARPPDRDLYDRLQALLPIRVLTMAPEEDESFSFLRHATAAGTRIQIGHSDASFETATAALAAGAAGFTHLFNAMRPMQHRDPGTAGAALAGAFWAELIPDLQHVAPGAILAALRAIPSLYGITDAIEATEMPDGDYHLGRHAIRKVGPTARLADGTLAGSVLTMDQALRNLVGVGLPVAEASRRLSALPAGYLGLPDRGRLAPGAVADLVVLGGDLRLLTVICRGQPVV